MATAWAYIYYVQSICNQNAIKPVKIGCLSAGGCLFSGTADVNGSSEQVDSAGKEADLASLNWENGAPVNTQTFSYLQLG